VVVLVTVLVAVVVEVPPGTVTVAVALPAHALISAIEPMVAPPTMRPASLRKSLLDRAGFFCFSFCDNLNLQI
jgi:hypothetical protein